MIRHRYLRGIDNMKITNVELTPTVYVRLKNPLIDSITRKTHERHCAVLIRTDEGITGVGPIHHYGIEGIKAVIETEFKDVILGEDPFSYERIWDKMYWHSSKFGRKGIPIEALGSIDLAIWDIMGKATGKPVYKLMGGYRDKVKAYYSGIDLHLTIPELVKFHQEGIEDGYDTIKTKLGKVDPNKDIERVKALRDALGNDINIAVDANNLWTANRAITQAKKLERFDIFWLEEPTQPEDTQGLAKVAASTGIPIALGEEEFGEYAFRDLIERGIVGIIIGMPTKFGGLTAWRRVAAMAHAYNIPFAPQGGLEGMHAAASIPNALMIEAGAIGAGTSRAEWKVPSLYKPPPTYAGKGYFELPQTPGLGIEIDYELIKKQKDVPWEPYVHIPPYSSIPSKARL